MTLKVSHKFKPIGQAQLVRGPQQKSALVSAATLRIAPSASIASMRGQGVQIENDKGQVIEATIQEAQPDNGTVLLFLEFSAKKAFRWSS